MDSSQTALAALAVSAGIVAGAALAWTLSKRWYGRRLLAARQAADKSDQSALAAQEHALRARRQVEALSSELATHKKAVAETELLLQQARESEKQLLLEAEEARAQAALAQQHGPDTTPSFADTQLMS